MCAIEDGLVFCIYERVNSVVLMAMRKVNPAAPCLDTSGYGRCYSAPPYRSPYPSRTTGGSVRCYWGLASRRRDLIVSAAENDSGEAVPGFLVRSCGVSRSQHPDFKNKKSEKVLWLSSKLDPSSVDIELAGKAVGPEKSKNISWNLRLGRHDKAKEYEKTIELFQQMQREGIILDKFTFIPVLRGCAGLRYLDLGRHIHKQIIQSGCESDIYMSSVLVDMYTKCGSIEDAWMVFNKMPVRNVVVWSSIVMGYVKCGQGQKALELSQQMQQEGVEPNSMTFVAVLNACASLGALDEGKCVHKQIIERGLESELFISSSLVDMYAKCGSIEDAERVFNKMPKRDVVSWNSMIQGHVKCGQGLKALDVCRQMQEEGQKPNPLTFVAMLNACALLGALDEGKRVHQKIIQRGYQSNVFVARSLISMYAKCGSIEDAWTVFRKMPTRAVVAWNAMVLGLVRCGQVQNALDLYKRMQFEGVEPDPVTFVGALNACASKGALEEGRSVHKEIIQSGCECDVFVGSSLVDMYAKCGSIEESWRVFSQMRIRNVVSWTSMILGYVRSGEGRKALDLFQQMQQHGVEAGTYTFVGVLKACAILMVLDEGRHIHEEIVQRGFESDVLVGTSLIDMYAKCGSIEEAEGVFNNMPANYVACWNAIILGYVKCGQGQRAIELAQQMQLKGVKSDAVTFVGILGACALVGSLKQGRLVHEKIISEGYESDVFVGSSLIDMYAKCGSIEDAQKAYDKVPTPNLFCRNAMLLGHVKCGDGRKALEVAHKLQVEGFDPDRVTFVGILNACAMLGSLQEGRSVHEQIIQKDYGSDKFVASSLIDMYAKCGCIGDAWKVFKLMIPCDVVCWNTMIMGLVRCGQGQKALKLFENMQQEGVKPNSVTLTGVLNACATVVALENGRCVHEQITQKGLESDIYVASSLIDMYAKCGSIEDAERVFSKIPRHDVVSWTAMLGGYAIHGHAKKAIAHFKLMCQEGIEIDGVAFVSLLSACSHAGLVDEGLHYFECMTGVYNISATVEHYACIIDLLARAHRLDEAEDLIKSMKCEPSATVWMSLLSGCRIHNDVEIAERVVKRVLELDPGNASGYALLSNIYAAAGKWEISANVRRQSLERGVEVKPRCSWIEVNSEVHSFSTSDDTHPRIMEIHAELERVFAQMKDAGYVHT